MNKLILASSSPRRKDLLTDLGVNFEIQVSDIDESLLDNESSQQLVFRLAQEKARAIANIHPERFVLAADTIVYLEQSGKEVILGKPKDESDAFSMLKLIQGRAHKVATAYSLQCLEKKINLTKIVNTLVQFVALDDNEIKKYIATKEPLDKAGSYAAQGRGASFIERIEGSYTNVVGLPLAEVSQDLKKYDLL
ncbi:MAG: septum formation inhibitor Maf [Proteobacteria bacterium]|nr:septum formation inhibitor Maf [Pseudomonadota bacterium]